MPPISTAGFELFEETARELCPPAAATHFVELARRIAASLELGIAGGQGVMLAPGERFQAQRNRSGTMSNPARVVTDKEQADPYAGSSLVPMLLVGLALTLIGMIAAVMLS